jgi:hypothetical protein
MFPIQRIPNHQGDLTLLFPVGRSLEIIGTKFSGHSVGSIGASFGVAPPGAPVSFAPGTLYKVDTKRRTSAELYHGEAKLQL